MKRLIRGLFVASLIAILFLLSDG
jgi:hypothetical protein